MLAAVCADVVVREEMNQVQLQQQAAGTTFLYNAAGQPVGVALPPQPSSYESYKSGQSMSAGIILISVGVLSIIFNVVGYTLEEVMIYGSQGIWCGILVSRLHYMNIVFFCFMFKSQWITLY